MSDRQLLKRYLLGSLSPEERIKVENRYLSNASDFEELTEIENDLFDSYARGTLSLVERNEFEQKCLGSRQVQARIGFALALAEISREHDQVALIEKPSLWERLVLGVHSNRLKLQWAVVASAAALALALGSLHWMNNREMEAGLHEPKVGPGRSDHLPAITGPSFHQAPRVGSAAGIEIAKNDVPKVTEFTLRLNPGLSQGLTPSVISRGSSPSESPVGKTKSTLFVVPSGISHITLQLRLKKGNEYREFKAEVETAEGARIERIEALRKQLVHGMPTVFVRLPARLFPSGDYVAKLDGIAQDTSTDERIEEYSFSIIRK